MQVKINIRGRQYTVRGDETGEDIRKLAAEVDARMTEVASRTRSFDEYTVAMLTAAGLMASLVEGSSQPFLALIACAIAAGATGFSHVNDSGFWMISRYMGMTEKQTLKTWTLISTAISLVSFAIILLLGLFIK